MNHIFDVAIIGGGINGCGCAADAALRGLSVLLCEQDDLAAKTSSKSTKLIHGGLRYLEQFNFSLVKKSLDERQKLLDLAPHLVRPLQCIIAQQDQTRPLWMLRAGLFLYDNLSRSSKLKSSSLINRAQNPVYFESLKPQLTQALSFYDAYTDDARLTIANALQAKAHGAKIMPYTKLIAAEMCDGRWFLTLEDKVCKKFQIMAKSIVNATGAWVGIISKLLDVSCKHEISLIKGSHILLPKLYRGEHAYLLQHDDGRIVFVVPYQGYTMVGTTDVEFSGDIDFVEIDESEISYLCAIVNRYFNKSCKASDIIMSWSALRPLLADPRKKPSTLSRDYSFQFSNYPAPVITIYGGKITTYRKLSAEAVDQLSCIFPKLAKSITAITPLPGSSIGAMNFSDYQNYAYKKYNWLNNDILRRYLQTYGAGVENFLSECTHIEELGQCFSKTLYKIEIDYLLKEEWVHNCDDILWRRTKLGLTASTVEVRAIASYLASSS